MKLVLRIENKRPVELEDLARSMFAVGDEYRRFVATNLPEADAGDVKLYVREIRTGSVIAELVALAPYALQLMDTGLTVLEYAKRLKELADWATGKSDAKPEALEKATLQSLSHLLEPVAKDNGSQLNVGAVNVHGNVVLNVTVSSVEANAGQNRIGREIAAQKEPTTGLHEQVVMYWAQARNQPDGATGDKARIESIYKGDVKVRFANDQLKAQMLFEPNHPFELAFVVDVQVETVNDKPVLYKVLKIHEQLPRNT